MSARLAGLLLAFGLGLAPLHAQTPCTPTPAYSTCDLTFELNDQEARAHPNPYWTVELEAEFRSPRFKTFRMPAFWDGGRKMIIRFAPTEAGQWDYRVTSNLSRFDGKLGHVEATPSDSPGFIQPANVHHWKYDNNQPHLWMGDTCYRFATIDRTLFEKIVEARAAQKFNHLRGLIIGWGSGPSAAYAKPDLPNPGYFDELDYRIRALNAKGIIVDLVLAGDENRLEDLFPDWQQRQRFIRYMVSRYAPMNVTWQGVQEFEEYKNGRALLKEIGTLIKKLDPYDHPRSTHTIATSSPLLADGWMNYITYQSFTDDLGAIEHQIYPNAQVNAEFAYEDSGAGKTHPHHVSSDEFRHRLWNVTMDGQYPTFGNTGTYGGKTTTPDARYLESPGAHAMTVWYNFFNETRHWELEPYFDVDGGRAVALYDVEYILYVEKPSGPVEVLVAKHKYDVSWVNPINGEAIPVKDWKGEKFVGEPPDRTHDWVLHIERQGRKEGMLRSYKFESRAIEMQEVENNPQKLPFEITQPAGDVSVSHPPQFAVKLKRQTRATRTMLYLWTGEVAGSGQSFRVVGTGPGGTLRVPASITHELPANLTIRLMGMNANGKVYSTVRVNGLTK